MKGLNCPEVDNPHKKPNIGILGGICSGKSTVAAELVKLGCKAIDADRIAHEVLQEKAVKDRIVGIFNNTILDSSGQIDRRKLADVVFTGSDKLSLLNGIVHPFVLARVEQLIRQYSRDPKVKAIVLDMPLMLEVGWNKRCDRVIFIDCERQLRVERAKKMGLFDENEFKIRENFQISLDSKVDIADNIVNNNSGFSALVRQVTDIFSCVIDN